MTPAVPASGERRKDSSATNPDRRTMVNATPKLVGAVTDGSTVRRYAFIPAAERQADWVEVRFDAIPEADWDSVLNACDQLEATETPVLATIRLEGEGGSWSPDDEARVEAFQRVLQHVSWIDVEVGSRFADKIIALAHKVQRRVVVSSHDFECTPDTEGLKRTYDKAIELGADIVKLSFMVKSVADAARLVEFTTTHGQDGKLCVIGMGAAYSSLRAFLPAVGSRLTYAHLDPIPSAPGQLSVEGLARMLELTVPAYRESVAIRSGLTTGS